MPCPANRVLLPGVLWAALWAAGGIAWADRPSSGQDGVLWHEDFEQLPAAVPIDKADAWRAFAGFHGSAPQATVAAKAGRNGSAALAVSHTENFRADNWGVQKKLPSPISDGIVWLEGYFHAPVEWTGDLYFDARSGRSVVARVAAARQAADGQEPQLRAHASWTHAYWRMYRNVPLKEDWYRITMRLDLDQGTYAAWIDDFVLGEELPLCSREPIDTLHLGLGGTAASPARVDDLRISRTAPQERELRPLLPQPEPGLLFRMAVVGDPQVGFTDYKADLIRFQETVRQINRSGAELTLVMGDMVHDAKNEQGYRDVREASKALKGPCYFVRGNHEELELYQKHFHPQADFSFTHKGWRFVFLDAIGAQRGLTEEQLALAEKEFRAAQQAGERAMLCLHVSPWQENERGRSTYNQIGPGRDRLLQLLHDYHVQFCFSGHYHRGWWHTEQQGTHYMVFGGTALVKGGWLGWCTFDVYADRVVMHQKPVFFAYERPGAEAFYSFSNHQWVLYKDTHKQFPYLQHAPATIPLR